MNNTEFWTIVGILLAILGASLTVYGVREYILLMKEGTLQLDQNTQITWAIDDKAFPDQLNIYTAAKNNDLSVFRQILKHCGFPENSIAFTDGTSFENDFWRVTIKGSEATFSAKGLDPETSASPSIAESKKLAVDVLKKFGFDMKDYTCLGHTCGDPPCILLWRYLIEGKFPIDFPYSIEIGFNNQNLAFLSVDFTKIEATGRAATISSDKIYRMLSNLNWYVSKKTSDKPKGKIKTLRITDYKITYSDIDDDNIYIPSLCLFAQATCFGDTAVFSVESEDIRAFTGKVTKIAPPDDAAVKKAKMIAETLKTSCEETSGLVGEAYYKLAVLHKNLENVSGAITYAEKAITYLNEIHGTDVLMTDVLTLAVELYETACDQENARRCREKLEKISNGTAE